MRYSSTALVGTALTLVASPALAESVRFEIIPDAISADDMSSDGRYVVGSQAGASYILDRQTGMTTTIVGSNDAVGISDDGSVIVGDIPDPKDPQGTFGEVAGRWTAATSWQSLGFLPSALNCPSKSNAYEVSADGGVVVGLSWDGCSGRGFVWSDGTGMLELESLANGGNRASVVSADGSVIAGFAQGTFSRTPAMWDGMTTVGTLLDPPNGDVEGEVFGIDDDGSVLLVRWAEGADFNAVTWTETSGVTVIDAGQLIPGWAGNPMDIDDDGTIVGFDSLGGNRQAWIALPYPGAGGSTEWNMVSITTFVGSQGGTIPDGFAPHVAQAISTDGRTIIGHSGLPSPGGFVITRCPEDIDIDGSVSVTDLLDLLGDWGSCPDCGAGPFNCRSDINRDCEIDIVDLLALLSNWGDCP